MYTNGGVVSGFHEYDLARIREEAVVREGDAGNVQGYSWFLVGILALLRKARKTHFQYIWWMGRFTVVESRHPRYGLRHDDGKRSRFLLHVSGMRRYSPLPEHKGTSPLVQLARLAPEG